MPRRRVRNIRRHCRGYSARLLIKRGNGVEVRAHARFAHLVAGVLFKCRPQLCLGKAGFAGKVKAVDRWWVGFGRAATARTAGTAWAPWRRAAGRGRTWRRAIICLGQRRQSERQRHERDQRDVGFAQFLFPSFVAMPLAGQPTCSACREPRRLATGFEKQKRPKQPAQAEF